LSRYPEHTDIDFCRYEPLLAIIAFGSWVEVKANAPEVAIPRVSITDREARSALTSDGDAGKPEPHDYGWMGVRQRLMRAETLFRGSHKPLRSLGTMYSAGSAGVQSCVDFGASLAAHALAALWDPLGA
jgi:hypothetical protein